ALLFLLLLLPLAARAEAQDFSAGCILFPNHSHQTGSPGHGPPGTGMGVWLSSDYPIRPPLEWILAHAEEFRLDAAQRTRLQGLLEEFLAAERSLEALH